MRDSLRARGYGLLEIALGIAIAALLVAGAMMYFVNADYNRKTKESVEAVSAVYNAVAQLYAGTSSYEGISDTVLAQSKLLPNKFIRGNRLKNPFGGTFQIVASNYNLGSAQSVQIKLFSIPQKACVELVGKDFGTTVRWVMVSGTQISGRQPTIQESLAMCAHPHFNTVTWDFR